MKTTIGTTTGFHLQRLALELFRRGEDVSYFSYMPRYRMRRAGLVPPWSMSLFQSTLPNSAMALMRGTPWQMRNVESMLARTDLDIARRLVPCDLYIGLSAMAVSSAARARELGATVIIERGSHHVLSQNELVKSDGGLGLSSRYIDRELASYEQADYITVLSDQSARSFMDHGFPKERLFVCPLGVDLEQFQSTPRPGGPVRLLFVGGWSHRKGVDLLREAVHERPNWQVTHVGMEAGVPFPRNDKQFRSLGHLRHDQLATVMASHHILVLPSREDGFGMVLLEALAAGLPVVASRMTGGPDIQQNLKNSEWVELVESNDASDLLRGLDSMVAREAKSIYGDVRQRFTPEDREFYSWAGYADRYLTFLKEIDAHREAVK